MIRLLLYFVMIFVIVAGVFAEPAIKNFASGTVLFVQQKKTIAIEIAETQTQRRKGLMFRPSLASNRGMLFVFERQGIQRVWMKNTLIPLDILFISAQGQIGSVYKGLQPCKKKLCDIYESVSDAKYMLEINAGVIDQEDIKIGQKLLFFLPKK